MKSNNNFFKVSTFIILTIIIGKIFGLIKQFLMGWTYGASVETDIYFLADSFVALISTILAYSISVTYLPLYVKEKLKSSNKKMEFNSKYLFVISVLSFSIFVIIFLISPLISKFLGNNYSILEQSTLSNFLKFFSISIFIFSISAIASSTLDGENKFIYSKMKILFSSSFTIIFILLFSDQLGLYAPIYGFILGYFVHMIIVLIISLKIVKFKFPKLKISIFKEKFFTLIIPVIISSIGLEINRIIDKYIATNLDEGGVSALYYGQILTTDIIVALFISSFAPIFIARLSENLSSQNIIKNNINFSNILFYLIIPLAFLSLIFSKEISILVFGSSFNESSHQLTSISIIGYSIGFFALPVRYIILNTFYAMGKTKDIMYINFIGVITNIILSLTLYKIFGVFGIALSTSISTIVISVIFYLRAKKTIYNYRLVGLNEIIKIFISSIIALMIITLISKTLLLEKNNFNLILISSVFLIIYFLSTLLLKSNILLKIKYLNFKKERKI